MVNKTEDLDQQLKQLNINATAEQLEKLLDYLALLQKWNKAFNLTAITGYNEMVRLHLIDSASVYPFIKAESILDVGTGAGLPGLVLAVLYPNKKFTLLDSNSKKIRFLRQCKVELKLKNIFPEHARVEAYESTDKFGAVISRAFASLDDFIDKCTQHLQPDGVLLAMKGREQEPLEIKHSIHELVLPNDNVARHLTVIHRVDIKNQ